jgi:hypothetical protein
MAFLGSSGFGRPGTVRRGRFILLPIFLVALSLVALSPTAFAAG